MSEISNIPNEAMGQAGDFASDAIVVSKKWVDKALVSDREETKIKWEDSKDELYTYFGKCPCGNNSVISGSKYCNECGKKII